VAGRSLGNGAGGGRCPTHDNCSNGRLVATTAGPKSCGQAARRGPCEVCAAAAHGPQSRAEDVERASGQPLKRAPGIGKQQFLTHLPPLAAGNGARRRGKRAAALWARPSAAGETVAFSHPAAGVIRNIGGQADRPLLHVGYTITTDSLRCLLQAGEAKGVTMTALLAKAVAVVLARHPSGQAAYSEAGMVLSAAVNCAWAVAMMTRGPAHARLWQPPDKTGQFIPSRAAGRPVARSRNQNSSSQPSTAPAPSPSPTWGMYCVDRFGLPSCAGPPGANPGCGGFSRPCWWRASDGSIIVKRQMAGWEPPADHRAFYWHPRRAFLKDLAALIETDPESLPSDVSAAPEDGVSTPTYDFSSLRLRS